MYREHFHIEFSGPFILVSPVKTDFPNRDAFLIDDKAVAIGIVARINHACKPGMGPCFRKIVRSTNRRHGFDVGPEGANEGQLFKAWRSYVHLFPLEFLG